MKFSSRYGALKNTQNRIISFTTAAVIAVASLSGAAPLFFSQKALAAPVPQVVYNALPSVSPTTNYPSQPFQAQQTDELGDYVHLAGSNRTLNTVTVTMSDWAKFSDYSSNPAYSSNSTSWSHPVTLNVYSNSLGSDGAPNDKLATVTKTINIPWRPASDPSCGNTSNGKGWMDGTCHDFSGIAFNASFDLSSQNVVLPNDIIVSVAFNTQTWGYHPTGTPGPYDSLNIAIPSGQTASVGTDDSTDAVFWNTHTCSYYSIAGVCNVLRKDTGWTPNGTVAFKVTATPVDTSTTVFVNDPKYVRENNGGDLAAQIVTPDTTQDVRFYVDGNTSTFYPGNNVGGAGATTSWWRLNTPLPAGQHTISAQIKISGNWYAVADTALVYSLDTPWAQYVIPGASQYFRPNDKVVRVKVDDEFNQFNQMKTVINGVTYTVNRADCSDQGDYMLCDLQNLNLSAGSYTATTTTYTKANNRLDNLVSPAFTIDNNPPTLTSFHILQTRTVYRDSVQVSANATDDNGVQNVTFYVTTPRVGDGVCDGNGTHLASATGALTSGSTYTATIDTSSLTGNYCLNAVAGDNAANHSAVSRFGAAFDNIKPTVAITNPTSGSYYKGAVPVQADLSDVNSGLSEYRTVIQTKNASNIWEEVYDGAWTAVTGTTFSGTVYNWHTKNGNYPDGLYRVKVFTKDVAGNKNVTHVDVFVDNTRPVITFTNPLSFNGSSYNQNLKNGPNFSITANDNNGSGIAKTALRIFNSDGTHSTAWCSPATPGNSTACDASGLADGEYYVRAVSTDNVGNKRIVTKHFTVDNTAPEITMSSVASNVRGMLHLTGTASDATSGLRYSNTNTTGGDRIRVKFRPITGSSVGMSVRTYYVNVDSSGNWSLDVNTTDSWFTDGQKYRIVSRANDNVGATYNDSNTAAVNAEIIIDNTAPQNVNAGPNQTLTSGLKSTALAGSADDATIYAWTLISGPGNVTFGDASAATTTVSADNYGTFIFRLTASDNAGNSASDTVTVTFNAATAATTTSSSSVQSLISANISQNSNGTNGSNSGQVLGSSTGISSDSTKKGNVKGATTEKKQVENSSAFLGLGWYWLIVLAAVGALGYLFVVRRADRA